MARQQPRLTRAEIAKILTNHDETVVDAVCEILARTYDGLTNAQWAWAFLLRHADYQDAYKDVSHKLKSAPKAIKDGIDGGGTVPKHLPLDTSVDWLYLDPPPQAARTFGEWKDEIDDLRKRGVSVHPSIGISDSLLPDRPFGIKKWIDPEVVAENDPVITKDLFHRPEIVFAPAVRLMRKADLKIPQITHDLPKIIELPSRPFRHVFLDDGEAVVVFDVRIGLEGQLNDATDQLEEYRAALNELSPPNASPINTIDPDFYATLLTAFDLNMLDELTDQEIAHIMTSPSRGSTVALVKGWLRKARGLVARGYQAVPFLTDNRETIPGG
jgi:hypothetical protein